MPLITSTTNLNKLKFGIGNAGDRFDNGSSNQPYIRKDIPGVDVDNPNPTPIAQVDDNGNIIYGDLEPSSLDILFRGGLNAPRDAVTDVSRLSQMLFDTKSPNGLIFTANQQILSRTSVMTEASYGAGYGRNTQPDFLEGEGGGALASGIYLPTSTLAQAGVGFTGTHLNLMGLDPTSPNGITGQTSGLSNLFGATGPGGGLRTYLSAIAENQKPSEFEFFPNTQIQSNQPNKLSNAPFGGERDTTTTLFDNITVNQVDTGIFNNRLINIFQDRQQVTSDSPDVISYQGGPGSILGIGTTNIRFASERTGVNNKLALNDGNLYFYGQDPTYKTKGTLSPLYNNFQSRLGVSRLASNENIFTSTILSDVGNNALQNLNSLSSTYTLAGSLPGDNNANSTQTSRGVYSPQGNSTKVFDFNQIKSRPIVGKGGGPITPDNVSDFRQTIINTAGDSGAPLDASSTLAKTAPYSTKSGWKRTNLGSPGSKRNVLNYGFKANSEEAKRDIVDKINGLLMYEGEGPNGELAINDYCKFRIAAIDNSPDAGDNAVYMHFRAFLDAFSDNYNASWSPIRFSGRGDNLYSYGGFERTINLGFTCYAQSKAELIPMYRKLNYLASTMAPDYNTAGFMRGNLVRLTLGGYLYEQPGFISQLTYEAPQESPWEIAIDQAGNSDNSVKELPFMIKVTGMTFTPIQKFLPQKVKPSAANGMDGNQVIDERFIALSNGFNNNYDANNGVSDYGANYLQTSTVGEDTDEDSGINQVDPNAGTGVSEQTRPGQGTAEDPNFTPTNSFVPTSQTQP